MRFTEWGPALTAWIAGMFEGEGNFCVRHDRKRARACPVAQLDSTDQDIIMRLAMALGVKPWGPYRGNGWNIKPLYKVAIAGRGAQELGHRLYPWLGTRRRLQVDKILAVEILPRRRDPITHRFAKSTPQSGGGDNIL